MSQPLLHLLHVKVMFPEICKKHFSAASAFLLAKVVHLFERLIIPRLRDSRVLSKKSTSTTFAAAFSLLPFAPSATTHA